MEGGVQREMGEGARGRERDLTCGSISRARLRERWRGGERSRGRERGREANERAWAIDFGKNANQLAFCQEK